MIIYDTLIELGPDSRMTYERPYLRYGELLKHRFYPITRNYGLSMQRALLNRHFIREVIGITYTHSKFLL